MVTGGEGAQLRASLGENNKQYHIQGQGISYGSVVSALSGLAKALEGVIHARRWELTGVGRDIVSRS